MPASYHHLALLCLAGALAAQTDSAQASRVLPIPWLPMEVHRYLPADLDTAASLASGIGTSQKSKSDTGTGLKIGGSKTIKVGVGGNGGVALDQTLYLTADGELSPGVHLKARLSDGDMPLSPQGSSASLREIDELYLELESKHWGLRLGDLEWRVRPDLAPGFDRRIRGVAGAWKGSSDTVSITLGGPQAKWKRILIQGVEGRQEGYVLASWQGGLHGVVVPGTEVVRINGETVKRGSDADYLVRYSEGLLDFNPHRRISSSDLIEVEFQSADMDYEQSFAASQVSGHKGLLRWHAWGARQSDDAAHPLVYAPDTLTRRILSEAGSDPNFAKLLDGQILPLPTQTGEAGIRLRLGDSALWVGTDLRGSDFDPNVVSRVDSRATGYFGTGAAGFQIGNFLSKGGVGRFTTTLRADRLDARYHGLTSTDSLGSSSGGLWTPAGSGERTSANSSVNWSLLPGIGITSEAGARIDSFGWTSRSFTNIGIDKSSSKQILSSMEWVQLDDGRKPLEQTRTKARFAWPVGEFAPSLDVGSETRDSWSGIDQRRWSNLSILTGSSWHPESSNLQIGLFGSGRKDAIRPSASTQQEDTARSIGANSKIRWTPALGDLDVQIDWKNLQTRQVPSLPWVVSESWLGSASAGIWPFPGLRSLGKWKLSSASYQPEIPRYDTVPVGTGTYRYDSLLRVVVPSDEGNLRFAGTRLDTSRPAVLASQRSLSGEIELEPKKLFPGLGGFIADIGGRAHGDWEESDSSGATRIVPHFDDQGLSNAITGRSELGVDGWWGHDRNRLEVGWSRTLAVQTAPIVSKTRDMSEHLHWLTSTISGHRFDFFATHGDLRDRQPDRLRLESYWSTDPSITIRVLQSVELRPGWYSKWADGSEPKTTFSATLQAPYTSLRASLPHNLSLQGELRRATANVDALAGSRLSDGYPDGVTWRASSSLDWAWKDHVQAKAEWVARKEPEKPWFQKLSCEAKAIF